MSVLSQHLDEYLRLRRMLGHDLAEAHRLLPRFVAYLDDHGLEFVTIQAALGGRLSRRCRRAAPSRGTAGWWCAGLRAICQGSIRGPRSHSLGWSGSRASGGRHSSSPTPTCLP